MPYIPDPPSALTGPLAEYLRQVAQALRTTPNWSFFSGTTPESVITGRYGDFAINKGSASTLTRLWFKTGPDNGTVSTTSWKKVGLL